MKRFESWKQRTNVLGLGEAKGLTQQQENDLANRPIFSEKKTPWCYRFLPVLEDIGFVSLLIIVEGSRSRTGKAMVPKSGLLSVVVNAVTEGSVSKRLI